MPTPPKTTQSNPKKEARRTKAHRSGPLPLSPLAPHALSPYVRLTYAAHRSRLSPRGHLAATGHPATLHPWPPHAESACTSALQCAASEHAKFSWSRGRTRPRAHNRWVWGVNQRRAAGRLAAWAVRRQVLRRWRCLAPRAGREAPSRGPGSGLELGSGRVRVRIRVLALALTLPLTLALTSRWPFLSSRDSRAASALGWG